MNITGERVFYDEYQGDKIHFSTFYGRIKRGYTMEEAISMKIEKSGRKKNKTGGSGGHQSKYKPSDEEIQETKEVEKYREEIKILKKENEKLQKKNRIKNCIDPYYST